MNPDYFLHYLTLSEATDYIKGQDRRHRQQWEMTRMIACGLGVDYFEFTWEKENPKSEEALTEEQKEWEALRRKAEAINNRNKKQQ